MSKPSETSAGWDRPAVLRRTAHSFCASLISPPPPKELLRKYFHSSPKITEHGPSWANKRLPFLGKTFAGHEGCLQYFSTLSDTLKMHMKESTFPTEEEYIVDEISNAVSVVGNASFESVKTGKSWEETFIYRLSEFDEEGKIGHWEIWADPLSAWEAVGED